MKTGKSVVPWLRGCTHGEVLAADHAVAVEPLAAELLRGAVRRVRPLDGDAVVVGVLGAELERVAGDRHQHRLLRVEHAARRVHAQALHVRGLDGPSDATTARVDDLNREEG